MECKNLKCIQGITIELGLNNPYIFKLLKMKIGAFSVSSSKSIVCFDKISILANLFYNSSKVAIVGIEEIRKDECQFKPAMHALFYCLEESTNYTISYTVDLS